MTGDAMTGEAIADAVRSAIKPLLQAIVFHPEDVSVDCDVSANRTVFIHLTVNKRDRGIVIGRGGQTAYALRILSWSVCKKHKFTPVLEIVDDGN